MSDHEYRKVWGGSHPHFRRYRPKCPICGGETWSTGCYYGHCKTKIREDTTKAKPRTREDRP